MERTTATSPPFLFSFISYNQVSDILFFSIKFWSFLFFPIFIYSILSTFWLLASNLLVLLNRSIFQKCLELFLRIPIGFFSKYMSFFNFVPHRLNILIMRPTHSESTTKKFFLTGKNSLIYDLFSSTYTFLCPTHLCYCVWLICILFCQLSQILCTRSDSIHSLLCTITGYSPLAYSFHSQYLLHLFFW